MFPNCIYYNCLSLEFFKISSWQRILHILTVVKYTSLNILILAKTGINFSNTLQNNLIFKYSDQLQQVFREGAIIYFQNE